MNLFDLLVTQALKNQPTLSPLRRVVEKELLHHEILRILSHEGLLVHLTFIGGTCLHSCYGGIRLSEDLDFTGGIHFTRSHLSTMGEILVKTLHTKYGLVVHVSEPMRDEGDVDTWKVRVEPQHHHLPGQRIHIDICKVPSYKRRPMMLLNPYGVDMGTGGLLIQAESREEIYADKLLAFALRPNRIKYRDLWDIAWLHQEGVKPSIELIPQKLQDRDLKASPFLEAFVTRKESLSSDKKLFSECKKEMSRFLPPSHVATIENPDFWTFMIHLMGELESQVANHCRHA